jgi:hypothetical protein
LSSAEVTANLEDGLQSTRFDHRVYPDCQHGAEHDDDLEHVSKNYSAKASLMDKKKLSTRTTSMLCAHASTVAMNYGRKGKTMTFFSKLWGILKVYIKKYFFFLRMPVIFSSE